MKPSCIAANGAGALPRSMAWSPDGKKITYTLFTLGDVLGTIKSFDVAGKQAEPLASFKNELMFEVVWLPGGQWLLARYNQKGPSYVRSQIGMVSHSGGQIQPVTRDANEYDTLTLSADGKTAATVQVRTAYSLSLLPGAGTQGNSTVQPLAQGQDVQSVACAHHSKLLISDWQSVRHMNIDGGQQSTIVSDSISWIPDIARCGDRYIVVAWAFHGGTNQVHLLRSRSDGSQGAQLTNGAYDRFADR